MVYLILLILIVFCAIIFSKANSTNRNKYFTIGVACLLILYSSFRGIDYNSDMGEYIASFNQYSNYTFKQILQLYNLDIKSPTYHFVGWIVAKISGSEQIWLSIIAVFFVSTVSYLIYKESKLPFVSFIAFLSLGFFLFSLTGLRQTVAMGFLIISYFSAKDNKFFKFLFFVLVASLFHDSALIFLILYPIRNLKFGWFHVFFISACLVVSLFFKSQFKEFLGELFKDSYFGIYADSDKALNFSGIIMQLAIFTFNLFYYKGVTNKNKNALILYNCAFLGLSFQLFSIVIAEMFRISRYFAIFNLVLIPLSIMAEPSKKWRNVETVLITTVLFVYIFVFGLPSYTFFWN